MNGRTTATKCGRFEATAGALLTVALGAAAPLAHGEVTMSTPGAFVVRHEAVVPVDAKAAYARLLAIETWWDSAHTYSGKAENLSLQAAPNGCWCEKLDDGGFIEHLRVIYVQPGKVLRLQGGLGPLQEMGAAGTLTFALKPEGSGTRVTMTYAVNAHAQPALEKISKPVDGVMGNALQRYARTMEGGSAAVPRN